jgi:site-specific DNA recombinase
MKAAIIYTRVSSEEQLEHGTSLDTQEQRCRAYAEQKNLMVVATFREQASGARWDRPMLAEARELIRTGQAAILIAYSPDRISRDVAHLSLLYSELAKFKGELQTVTMAIDSSPMGKAALQMAGVFGEMERALIVERSRRGKIETARRGKVMLSNLVPYGFDYANGKLTVNEGEAIWLREMYKWCGEERLSCYVIAQRLTAMGVRCKHGANEWRKATVNRILRNPTSKGTWVFRSGSDAVEVPVPGIVSPELWARAQERLEEGKHRTRSPIYHYLLTGRVRCGQCGHAYTGQGGSGHAYYGCQNRRRDGGITPKCFNRYHKAGQLDRRVWDAIENTLSDPDAIMTLFARPDDDEAEQEGLREQLGAVERKLVDLNRRMDVLLDLIESGDITRDQFRERKDKLEAERPGFTKLRSEINERLTSHAHARMTREQAEHLALYWQAAQKVSGRLFLADSQTGQNVFDQDGFRKWVLETMNARIFVDGDDVWLHGTVSDALVGPDGVLYRIQRGRPLPPGEPRPRQAHR